ncbi:MAG TPA: hypothetical protein VIX17_25540, partial [Pyrinomonadaceae bacterium]
SARRTEYDPSISALMKIDSLSCQSESACYVENLGGETVCLQALLVRAWLRRDELYYVHVYKWFGISVI